MSSAFACVLLQINTRVGDIPGNTAAILAAIEDARSQGADLLVTPELALTGYPPEDLLLRPALMARVDEALLAIAEAARGITVIVGAPQRAGHAATEWSLGHQTAGPARLHNSLVVCLDGQITAVYHRE